MSDNTSDKQINERLKKIEQNLAGVERELGQLASIKVEFPDSSVVPCDRIWNCSKCGSRLGIYDMKEDELRVRYRDFYAYWRAGKNGYLKIVCRSCSHINILNYTEGNK